MFACFSRTIHTLPSDGLCLRNAFAFIFIRPLPSNGLCLRRSFALAIDGSLPSKCPCNCHRRCPLPFPSKSPRMVFSLKPNAPQTAATSSVIDSLVLQHLPTQPCQGSSDCPKRGCLLFKVLQFTLCLRTAFAFETLLPLSS